MTEKKKTEWKRTRTKKIKFVTKNILRKWLEYFWIVVDLDLFNFIITSILRFFKIHFLLQGMWTRFFPAVQKARNIGLGTEPDMSIGEISKVFSDFNFHAPDHEEYPTSFVYNRKLGGGASLLVAPYPLAAATLFFPNAPDNAKVVGQIDEGTGVDIQGAMILSFPPTSKEMIGSSPKLPGYVPYLSLQNFGLFFE